MKLALAAPQFASPLHTVRHLTTAMLALMLVNGPASAFTIDLPNGQTGFVLAENRTGDMVGWFVPEDALPEFLGFLLDRNGSFLEIGPSFALSYGIRDNARAVDINDRGDIIGIWRPFLNGEPVHEGFLYTNGDYVMISFPELFVGGPHGDNNPCNDRQTLPTSIANNGDIHGRFEFGGVTAPCVFEGGIIRGTFLWRRGVYYTNDLPGYPRIPAGNAATGVLVAAGFIAFLVALTWHSPLLQPRAERVLVGTQARQWQVLAGCPQRAAGSCSPLDDRRPLKGAAPEPPASPR